MYVCKNCGRTYQTPENFCSNCGGQIVEEPMAQSQGYQIDPIYSGSVYQDSNGGKVQGIISMASAIAGAFFAFISFIMVVSILGDSIPYYYVEDEIIGAGFLSMLSLGGGIVGLVMSSIARSKGFVNGISTTGKIVGMIATIFSGFVLFLNMISCAAIM